MRKTALSLPRLWFAGTLLLAALSVLAGGRPAEAGRGNDELVLLEAEGRSFPVTTWLGSNPRYRDSVGGIYDHYDPERAGALLDEAGWKLEKDGLRRRDGVVLSMRLMTWGPGKAVGEAIQHQWTKLGVASAVNRGRMTDHAVRVGCVVLASVPVFALGLALLYFFGVRHALYTIANEAGWGRLWLPATTLGLIAAPPLARMIRTNLLQEFGRPYILAALSRGLRRRQIVRGAFRNVLLPVVTITALSAASLVGGAVVVESVFSWPGIGKYALDSILLHDYPVIQGYGFVTIVMILLINLGVDIVYICLDPRLRGRSGYGNAEGEAHA